MSQFDAFITSLRHGFGEQDAGLKFEVFCKWFLENDPEWSRTVDKVWLWDEYSRVPKGHCVDGIKLGSWVSTLRQKQSNLTPEQIDRLKAIDFVWDVADAAWRSGFNSLEVFFTREGHSLVPQRHLEGDFPLGSWVNTQRNLVQKLGLEKVSSLDELEFAWNVRITAWNKGLESLRQYYQREGHSNPRADHKEDEFKLGRWVSKQRSRKATLSPDQCEQLQQLEFIWDAREAAWQLAFGLLRKFYQENGHSTVPVSYEVEGTMLGTWIRNRKKEKATMSAARRRLLDSVDFDWAVRKD
jgi:hypothetical protein